jgi:hypothetical protein
MTAVVITVIKGSELLSVSVVCHFSKFITVSLAYKLIVNFLCDVCVMFA